MTISGLVKRAARALWRRAERIGRWTRHRSVHVVGDFGWIKESARAFDVMPTGLSLETDDSEWGYQVRSAPLAVPVGCWAVLTLQGNLRRGAISVGFLDQTGSTWLDNRVIPSGRVRERFLVDPKLSSVATLVFCNAQGGVSQIEIEQIRLEWMPESLAREIGNTESAIMDEIRSLIDEAAPASLRMGDVAPSAARTLWGTGVYLRTDYWVKIKAGGSYGHTCYVAQQLARTTEHLVCFMANRYELLDAMGIEQVVMDLPARSSNEIDVLRASRFYYDFLRDRVAALKPRYIYERSILGSYVGAQISRELGIPYILEYNGSEISLKRSFDERGYELEAAFVLAEQATFAQATAIVAVSEIISDGLRKQNVPSARILTNPNGCSPEDYAALSAAEKHERRAALGWSDEQCVVGFIGTFGGWHGIDVLAQALPEICKQCPTVQFLLIGDGNFRHLIDAAVEKNGLSARVHMPGVVPQAEAGALLACSDILVSPHSRNMIDSRFFGSPTKLFEYMSLGGAIVASRLEQIGEVLSPALSPDAFAGNAVPDAADERAVLCTPGDVDEFVEAVTGLVRHPELWPTLGRNARQALLENFTWERHVAKIWTHLLKQPGAGKEFA